MTARHRGPRRSRLRSWAKTPWLSRGCFTTTSSPMAAPSLRSCASTSLLRFRWQAHARSLKNSYHIPISDELFTDVNTAKFGHSGASRPTILRLLIMSEIGRRRTSMRTTRPWRSSATSRRLVCVYVCMCVCARARACVCVYTFYFPLFYFKSSCVPGEEGRVYNGTSS
jgi:hypothetical protein